MDQTKDSDFLLELKKTKDILQTGHEKISNILPTRNGSFGMYTSFKKKLKQYYKYLDLVLGKKRKYINKESTFMQLAEENDYYLFDDFEITPNFTKYKDDALDSLIFSPFSINFFAISFKDIFNKYFTGLEPIPQTDDELITILISPMMKKLNENMQYCPPYIKKIFTEGFNNGFFYKNDPDSIFQSKIIGKIFENPYLFNILKYTKKLNANKNDLNRMKAVINNNLIIKDGFFSGGEYLASLPSKNKPEKKDESQQNDILLINFKNLLINSKQIPDQLPSDFFSRNLADQIKYLLVDESDPRYPRQKIYYENLQKSIGQGREKVKILKSSLKEIEFQIRFQEYQSQVNNLIALIKMHSMAEGQDNYRIYFDYPQLFLNDLTMKLSAELTSSDSSQDDVNDKLTISSLIASKSDPMSLITILLKGATLKEFKERRPDLKFGEKSFRNRIESQREDDTNVSQRLIDFKENDPSQFKLLINEFAKSFSESNDPYNMMNEISVAYNNLKIATFGSLENVSDDDDEKDFIITLFKMVDLNNVFSTYVYLFEFLLAPIYKMKFIDICNNSHLKCVKKVLTDYVMSFYKGNGDVFKIAEFCRICKYEVDLVLKKNIEFLKKLASLIAENENERLSLERMFNNFIEIPPLKDGPSQFTFKVYQIDEDFSKIWICNVTELADSDYDEILLDDIQSLISSLERINES